MKMGFYHNIVWDKLFSPFVPIGMMADDKVNARAQHLPQGKGSASDAITLNGHVVNDLQSNAVTTWNDSFKFHPSVMPSGEGSLCEFERPAVRVIPICHRKEIVREVGRRNQIDLYAEFGVQCVHIRGRYVVHIGTFVTSTVEWIVRGTRRFADLDGPEASNALKIAELLHKKVEAVTVKEGLVTDRAISSTVLNPADDCSRGMLAHTLTHGHPWFTGSACLRWPEDQSPKKLVVQVPDTDANVWGHSKPHHSPSTLVIEEVCRATSSCFRSVQEIPAETNS